MFKLKKENEGMMMWCVAAGNNVPRRYSRKSLHVVENLVTDIKRTRVKIAGETYTLQDYGQTENKAVYENSSNYVWIVFRSKEALELYKTRLDNEKIIFRSCSPTTDLTDDQLQRIVSILEE